MLYLKPYKILKWIIALSLVWLLGTAYSIYNFPVSNLTEQAEVGIILGAAVSADKPSPVFAERIKHAINLYRAGNIKKLVFTGGIGEKQKVAESLVARNFTLQLGIANKDILTEKESLTTLQNFQFAKKLLKADEVGNCLIISDPLHMKRAMLMAKDLGFKAKPSATPTSLYQSFKTKIPFLLRELYFYHHYLLFAE